MSDTPQYYLTPDGDLRKAEGEKGPNGGNLNAPRLAPHNRSPLNAKQTIDDTLALHRKEHPYTPVARMALKDEQVWHRMAAYMLLAGRTNAEIALAAQVEPGTVSLLRSQQWFQELLAVLANRDGEEITGAFKSHALAAIERVAHLAEYAENERTKLAANVVIIEQAAGKPVQKNYNINAATNFSNEKEEYEAIQQELAALRARESGRTDLPTLTCSEGTRDTPLPSLSSPIIDIEPTKDL